MLFKLTHILYKSNDCARTSAAVVPFLSRFSSRSNGIDDGPRPLKSCSSTAEHDWCASGHMMQPPVHLR